jgi:ribosome-binding protein aMBF1 (putative translation factor)
MKSKSKNYRHKNRYAEFWRKARMNAGLTQNEIAVRLNYSNAQFISNIERGRSVYPTSTLPKLIDILGLNKSETIEALLELEREFLTEHLQSQGAP